MPASYAHYRFGKLLLPQMSPDVRQCIQRFRRMYDMGLHGPDIFFYANPFLNTAAGKLGKTTHTLTGREVLEQACTVAGTEAGRAYLYGLLAHYCLDKTCHPFINRMADAGEAPHIPLEAEFDRYLMETDGIAEPHHHDFTRHMKLTRGECMTVADVYPTATGGDVYRSVRFMAFAIRFLAGKDREKRRKLLLKLKPSLCDFFIPETPVTAWARMDSELLARFNRALREYPELLAQLEEHRKSGAPLGEDFAATFGGD